MTLWNCLEVNKPCETETSWNQRILEHVEASILTVALDRPRQATVLSSPSLCHYSDCNSLTFCTPPELTVNSYVRFMVLLKFTYSHKVLVKYTWPPKTTWKPAHGWKPTPTLEVLQSCTSIEPYTMVIPLTPHRTSFILGLLPTRKLHHQRMKKALPSNHSKLGCSCCLKAVCNLLITSLTELWNWPWREVILRSQRVPTVNKPSL